MTIGAQPLCKTSLLSKRNDVRPQRAHNSLVAVLPARNLAGQVAGQWQTHSRCMAMMACTASQSTSQQAPQQSKHLTSKGLSAAEARQMLVDSLPLESFKMTGVSFEGRQDLVSRLRPGDTAMTSLQCSQLLLCSSHCMTTGNHSCYTMSTLQITCRASYHDGQGA